MKRALFMTVGTGVGLEKEKKVKNLAHGLLTSIEHYNPEKIVFFGSEDSKETVESLKKQYYEKMGKELANYEFIELRDIDDFYECYTKIEEEIRKKGDYEIIIDYTSGTKTMTTTAAICAMLYQKKLSLVAGERGKNGIVIPGTEAVRIQNLFAAYDKYLLDKVKEAFNSYRFWEAIDYLEGIVALGEKEKYKKLAQGYDLWDKFEHGKAYELLKEVKDERTNKNKSFLGKLSKKEEKEKKEDFIADLMNNARRRIEEEKYDDAMARLYRTVELIGQYRLEKKYKIDASDVDIGRLRTLGMEEKIIEKYERLRDDKGKIKLNLTEDYELMKDLGDELGVKYLEDEHMKDLRQKRNDSILGHGLTPVKGEDVEKMFPKTEEYAKRVVDNLENLRRDSRFPKI